MLSRRVLFALVPTVAMASAACASNIDADQLRIFYVDWDVEHRSAWDANRVRSNYDAMIQLRGQSRVTTFLERIGIVSLSEIQPDLSPMDVRVVIDSCSGDDILATYIADQFSLYSEDKTLQMPIGEEFKNIFRAF